MIGPGFVARTVDGLLTGLHEAGTSHFALLQAFAPRALLERAIGHATETGYLQHEFGDSCLILRAKQATAEHVQVGSRRTWGLGCHDRVPSWRTEIPHDPWGWQAIL